MRIKLCTSSPSFYTHTHRYTYSHSFSLFCYHIHSYAYILLYITKEQVESYNDDVRQHVSIWILLTIFCLFVCFKAEWVCISIYFFFSSIFSAIHLFMHSFICSFILIVALFFFRGEITLTIYRHWANNSFKSVTVFILLRELCLKKTIWMNMKSDVNIFPVFSFTCMFQI